MNWIVGSLRIAVVVKRLDLDGGEIIKSLTWYESWMKKDFMILDSIINVRIVTSIMQWSNNGRLTDKRWLQDSNLQTGKFKDI